MFPLSLLASSIHVRFFFATSIHPLSLVLGTYGNITSAQCNKLRRFSYIIRRTARLAFDRHFPDTTGRRKRNSAVMEGKRACGLHDTRPTYRFRGERTTAIARASLSPIYIVTCLNVRICKGTSWHARHFSYSLAT